MLSSNTIRSFMFQNYKDFMDNSNCLNLTDLAQSAATNFGDNVDYEDIPEIYFDESVFVQNQLFKNNLINS